MHTYSSLLVSYPTGFSLPHSCSLHLAWLCCGPDSTPGKRVTNYHPASHFQLLRDPCDLGISPYVNHLPSAFELFATDVYQLGKIHIIYKEKRRKEEARGGKGRGRGKEEKGKERRNERKGKEKKKKRGKEARRERERKRKSVPCEFNIMYHNGNF